MFLNSKRFFNFDTSTILTYLIGCFLFSLGAKFFIDSNLGVDPLDSMILGIVNYTNLKIGTVSALVAILFLSIWSLWNKKWPIITPFITMTLVGYLIDFWNYLNIIYYFFGNINVPFGDIKSLAFLQAKGK